MFPDHPDRSRNVLAFPIHRCPVYSRGVLLETFLTRRNLYEEGIRFKEYLFHSYRSLGCLADYPVRSSRSPGSILSAGKARERVSQRLGVVERGRDLSHRRGPSLPFLPPSHRSTRVDLNWFRDRDCRHTLSLQNNILMQRKGIVRDVQHGAFSRKGQRERERRGRNGGTLRDPSSAFKFISRISFHGLRGRSTGDTREIASFLLVTLAARLSQRSIAPVIPRF